MSRGFPSSVLLLLQIGRRLFCSNNNGTDDFLKNVLLSHRIVEMLYHSKQCVNNGGCGFLLLWFLFVCKYFWNKTGSSCCNIIHETGSCHFDMTHFFRPVLFTVFRLLTDFVCLYNYEFWLSLCKIVRSSVILLLPLFTYINN